MIRPTGDINSSEHLNEGAVATSLNWYSCIEYGTSKTVKVVSLDPVVNTESDPITSVSSTVLQSLFPVLYSHVYKTNASEEKEPVKVAD